jgi:hypothetical protein
MVRKTVFALGARHRSQPHRFGRLERRAYRQMSEYSSRGVVAHVTLHNRFASRGRKRHGAHVILAITSTRRFRCPKRL